MKFCPTLIMIRSRLFSNSPLHNITPSKYEQQLENSEIISSAVTSDVLENNHAIHLDDMGSHKKSDDLAGYPLLSQPSSAEEAGSYPSTVLTNHLASTTYNQSYHPPQTPIVSSPYKWHQQVRVNQRSMSGPPNHDSNRYSTFKVPCSQKRIPSSHIAGINAVFLYFCRRSTIHGLNHMAQARTSKRRLFWFSISFMASMGFLVNMYYLIEKYVQRQVLTNVFHDYEGFVYPDITFCNINPIYFPPENTSEYDDLVKVLDEYNLTKKTIALSDYMFMGNYTGYSHPAWSFIIQCRYMQKSCNWRHFEITQLWPYGNCFTFNASKMGSHRNVSKNMRFNGFRPDFRVILYKALNAPPEYRIDPHNSPIVPSGVLVMLHEPHTYPHIGDSFIVDDSTQVDLKIVRKSHIQTLKNCKSIRTHFTYQDPYSKRNRTYIGREFDCVFNIVQQCLIKHCQCMWQSMPVDAAYSHLPFCLSFPNWRKLKNKCLRAFAFEMQGNKARASTCYQDLCEHTSFITVISHSKYPAVMERNTQRVWLKEMEKIEKQELQHYNATSLAQYALLPNPNIKTIEQAILENRHDLVNVDFVERNFMMLRVVPSSLFMDKVEETEEYPLSRLLSDIGGCVGLWVGASLITVFEFADLMLDFTEVSSYHSRNNNNTSKKNRNGNCNGRPGAVSTSVPSTNSELYSRFFQNINTHPLNNMSAFTDIDTSALESSLLREAEIEVTEEKNIELCDLSDAQNMNISDTQNINMISASCIETQQRRRSDQLTKQKARFGQLKRFSTLAVSEPVCTESTNYPLNSYLLYSGMPNELNSKQPRCRRANSCKRSECLTTTDIITSL